MDKMGDGDEKVQTSSYKISHEDVMYSVGLIMNFAYLKVAKRKDDKVLS